MPNSKQPTTPSHVFSSLARGTARFSSLARGTARFDLVRLMIWVALLASTAPGSAQSVAPAQQPAAPPAQSPAAAPAPGTVQAPPPAGVQYAQQAPAPIYAQPAPIYAPPPPGYGPPTPPPRARKGLMITGISVLGASYLISLISGAVLMDIPRQSCSDCKDVGPMLLIPLVGPFLAIPRSDGADGFWVLLGSLQLVGAGLTVAGIVKYLSSKRKAEEYYGLALPEGRSLSFDFSASPVRLGPSARLTF